MRHLLLACLSLSTAALATPPTCPWHDAATPEERTADAAAFDGFDKGIGERLADVQSVVVVLQGRVAYQYHRNADAETRRDMQSVTKSALAVLVGTALKQGQLKSLDQPVVELIPDWKALNPDPRAQAMTLRHLLSLTAGFEVNDPTGTAAPLAPEKAWARKLASAPGQAFAYDNSVQVLLAAVLEKVTGRTVRELARDQIVQPLGMAEPSYPRMFPALRTIDMARLGQLYLQDGRWGDRALLPDGFVADSIRPHSAGGPPVGMSYGLAWWMPSASTYMAVGYGGQFIWVHPPLDLVVAITSSTTAESNQRGQATQLLRGRLFQAAQKRWTPNCGR